ncbi:MAG: hypothetical protein NT142_16055 [Planctomycetota bacterium]|nr:hypothetical protein [Planctomycetota bacterium]
MWLIIAFGICFVTLGGLFFAWAVWLQSNLYTQPAEGMIWRAPAASAVVVASLAIWMLAARTAPGEIRPLQEAPKVKESIYFKELLVVDAEGNGETYRRTANDRTGYRGNESNRPLPGSYAEVKVKATEDAKDFTISFKRQTSPTGDITFQDDQGRQMDPEYMGTLKEKPKGRLLTILILNLVHLGAWIIAFGPLLGFGSGHAILMGLVGAILSNFTLLPYFLTVLTS